jgi:quinol---cytochrome c reductase iron-sulfur subunit, bacillus type
MPSRAGDDPDRRRFLKVATCALGGGVGLVIGVPVLRVVLDPVDKQTVTSPTEPLDLGLAERFRLGAPPQRVEIVAPLVKDGWTAATNVVLGAAWIRRIGPELDALDARSAVCPHLGCAVAYDTDKNNYLCPCHDSRFSVAGDRLSGPSERGLDQLPIAVRDKRLLLTWERYKVGSATKERA